MKIIPKVIIGIITTGVVVTGGVLTVKSIVDSKTNKLETVSSNSYKEFQEGNITINEMNKNIEQTNKNVTNSNENVVKQNNTEKTNEVKTPTETEAEKSEVQDKTVKVNIDVQSIASWWDWEENKECNLQVSLNGNFIYNKNFTQDNKQISINVTGKGEKDLRVYVDEGVSRVITINFDKDTTINVK